MFCSKCGNKLNDIWNVCPECGTIIIKTKNSSSSTNGHISDVKNQKIKKKKPIYKKVWFWILIIFVGFLLVPTGSNKEDDEARTTIQNVSDFSENEVKEDLDNEEIHEVINVDYEFIYGDILDSIPSGLSYAFYDIDKDGYQECFAQQGTCNADMIFEIYTTDGKSTAKLGEILGADTTLYECKNKNGFYTYYSRGDYELVEYVYIDDGNLKIETVAEDNTYSNITSPEVQHLLSMNNVSTEKEYNYLFPESNSSYYNIEALYSDYDYKTLWYGKNEIYARHGYIFKNSELQEYFEEQAWYTPTIEGAKFDEGVFNDYEKANIETFQTILEYYNSEESSEETSEETSITSSYEEFYQDGIIPRPGVYRNDNSPFFITIEEGVYGNVYTDAFVYINLYCQMEGDDYREEYTGMINLYNPGMLTIMTGVQSAAYVEYDCGLGKLSGSGVRGIVNDYVEMHRYYNLNMYDYDFYEDNEVSVYYLDK